MVPHPNLPKVIVMTSYSILQCYLSWAPKSFHQSRWPLGQHFTSTRRKRFANQDNSSTKSVWLHVTQRCMMTQLMTLISDGIDRCSWSMLQVSNIKLQPCNRIRIVSTASEGTSAKLVRWIRLNAPLELTETRQVCVELAPIQAQGSGRFAVGTPKCLVCLTFWFSI